MTDFAAGSAKQCIALHTQLNRRGFCLQNTGRRAQRQSHVVLCAIPAVGAKVRTAAGSRSGGRGRGSGVLKNQAGKIWGLVGKARPQLFLQLKHA